MIERFEVGQKLILSRNCKHYNYNHLDGKIIIVRELWDKDTGVLSDESGEISYRGSLNLEHFDYYGIHVNHEILDIVNRHQVKSFQAILDDGRIIHLSCLN